MPARATHTLSAIKTHNSTCDQIPLQSLYLDKHSGEFRGWRFGSFAPFDIVGDEAVPAPFRRFPLRNDKMIKRNGCYASLFREEGMFPSIPPKRPFRSKAMVYEDNVLLPWVVSSEVLVGERPGSFTHIGAYILFTSSDGSDPRENGKTYEVRFPQPFKGVAPYANDPTYIREASPTPST